METYVRKLYVAALLMGVASASAAAPHAQSALECGIAADMAVVAHSLAREEVQRAKADAIMVRIYDVAASARGMELMNEIMETAYTKRDAAPNAQKFAEELFATCMKTGGNMDKILGKRL
jgi:hypothetical protein